MDSRSLERSTESRFRGSEIEVSGVLGFRASRVVWGFGFRTSRWGEDRSKRVFKVESGRFAAWGFECKPES